ncbi:unnamed protein product [Rotaria sp. Silwood2]|nr:unnamed protein product [Rotaria sp. Silwood2]
MSIPFYEDEEDEAKETEEEFLLEPTQTKNGNRYVMVNTRLDYQHRSKDLTELCLYDFVSHFHKKVIDKSDRHLLKNPNGYEGERLHTEGTKMNERHTFERVHLQSSSHIIIKHTTLVVPVLLGPQISRRELEETRERYCRALLTLFVSWRSVHDLYAVNQTWFEAFEIRKPLISSSSLKIIENIQLLLECKHDRDEHLYQVLGKAQNDSKIDPILIHNCSDEDQNTEEDDPEQLLQMLSFVNETTTNAYYASTGNQEQRYLNDALQAIDNAHRRNIETRRDKARISLISGVDTLEVRDDEMQIEVVTVEIPTSPYKAQTTMVPPVTATMAVSFPTKPDTIKEFTLNCQQKYAFMIVTNHLDGENQLHTDTSDNQLLMCVPDCGGTGKSQLIRAITNLRKAILELPDNTTEHLPGYLPLVPEMPVLLTENIATELGLSNGTRGIFRQLVYDECCDDIHFDDTVFPKHTKFITLPKYALVEFSSCKLDSVLNELETKIIPISISEKRFLFHIKEFLSETITKAAKIAKRTTKISIKRKALPLIPAYSITTHKSQGQTLRKIIVDLVTPPGPVEVASIYVPLSHVKRVDDLLIVRPFEFSSLQVKPSAAQLQELKRLDTIAKKTQKSFASFL